MHIHLLRTDSDHPDFLALMRDLDAELAILDGDDHAFYAQYNKIAHIQHVIVAYQGETPVGCGAIKLYEPGVVEVKRMYVSPEVRNAGIATLILTELEKWANELSMVKCVLETGKNQPEAIRLYEKNAYQPIPNYGQYAGIENSVCFEKRLDP